MARTSDSPRHDALRQFLVKTGKEAGLRQVDLAKRLNAGIATAQLDVR
jgi:alkylation response protein AidB-like acyl-CoA dehydrogenase